MNNSIHPKPAVTPARRSLKDEFAFGPFTDDEKVRLSGLIDKGGIVAHIIRTYVTDTSEYKTGFRRDEKIRGFRNATSFFDQQAPVTILKYLGDSAHRRYHKVWEDLYRPAANLYLQAELSNLWQMLSEVTAPDNTDRAELFRAVCANAFSFDVAPSDVERFYEVWPGSRIAELPLLLPLCLKRHEATVQRLALARLEREVADLQRRFDDRPSDVAAPSAAHPVDDVGVEELREDLHGLETKVRTRLDQFATDIEIIGARAEQAAKQADGRVAGLTAEIREQEKQLSESLREHANSTQRTVAAQLDRRSDGLGQQIADLRAAVDALGDRLTKTEAQIQAPTLRAGLVSNLPSARPSVIADHVLMKQALSNNFKACEVAPACATRLHAALAAQLFVIVTGAPAFLALAACSRASCGARMATLSVAPTTAEVNDLLSRSVEFLGRTIPVSEFLSQVREIEGPVLLVFEGMNRAPTESYLLPLLLFRRLGEVSASAQSPVALQPAAWPRNLWLAGTAVQGPTTLPLSREVLAYSIVLESTAYASAPMPPPDLSEVRLEGDLCTPSVVTASELFEDLDEAFTDARSVIPTMRRFSSHFARFESDSGKRTLAVVESIAAPLVASLDDDDERQAAVEALKKFVSSAESLESLIRRLRRLVA